MFLDTAETERTDTDPGSMNQSSGPSLPDSLFKKTVVITDQCSGNEILYVCVPIVFLLMVSMVGGVGAGWYVWAGGLITLLIRALQMCQPSTGGWAT